jgi:predicted ATPase
MVTLILAVTVGVGGFAAAQYAAGFGTGWSVFSGLVCFGVFQGVSGIFIQKRVKRDMDGVQAVLAAGQRKLQEKMQRWQLRPPGSVQAAQKEIADDTRAFVKEALEKTGALRKYRLWVPMMERQIATAQLQLNWMIKDFRRVDELMPKAMFIDPTLSAIRIARMHMTGEDSAKIAKVYEKAVRRVRYNGNVLLAAAWSWIQVERGDADGAFKTLTEALKKSDDATLKRNHEVLMNNRVAHFSNSGIGDQWYSLLLEEPKVRMQRQRSVYR